MKKIIFILTLIILSSCVFASNIPEKIWIDFEDGKTVERFTQSPMINNPDLYQTDNCVKRIYQIEYDKFVERIYCAMPEGYNLFLIKHNLTDSEVKTIIEIVEEIECTSDWDCWLNDCINNQCVDGNSLCNEIAITDYNFKNPSCQYILDCFCVDNEIIKPREEIENINSVLIIPAKTRRTDSIMFRIK